MRVSMAVRVAETAALEAGVARAAVLVEGAAQVASHRPHTGT